MSNDIKLVVGEYSAEYYKCGSHAILLDIKDVDEDSIIKIVDEYKDKVEKWKEDEKEAKLIFKKYR